MRKSSYIILMVLFGMVLSLGGCAQKETTRVYDDGCIPKGIYQIRDDSQQWQGASVVTTIAGSMPQTYDYIPGKYIISGMQKGTVYEIPDERKQYEIIERFAFNVYDIHSGELIREIDVKEVVESYLGENEFVDYGLISGWVVAYNGRAYAFSVDAYKIVDNNQSWEERLDFCIDFDTGEFSKETDWSSPDSEWRNKDLSGAYYTFLYWGIDEQKDLFNINGLRSLSVDEERTENFIEYSMEDQKGRASIVKVRLTGDLLPEKNTKLYSLLPELKQYQGDGEACVAIYFDNRPNPEEIVKLFLEDGQEISYEGFEYVLLASETIDGKERRIYNYEEFEQWYLPHAERPENEGMKWEW